MYVCTNDSCAMHGNKLEDQAASALKFQCPVCRQSLQTDRQSDQPDIDVSGFPSVIALPLKEYYEETNPVLKLWHACDVIELTLRLMVIVGLADIKNLLNELPKALLRELQPRIDQPTLFSSLRNQLAHGGGVKKSVASQLLDIWKDRFEKVVESYSWLREFALVVKTEADAFGVLCGPNTLPAQYTPQGDAEQQALDSIFSRGDEVAFVRGQTVVPLWPMSIYGIPQSLRSGSPGSYLADTADLYS